MAIAWRSPDHPGVVRRLLARHQLSHEEVRHWVFHTGGRRVLEGCQRALNLSDADMAANFEVLRRYGNMQSGTVLFSLEETLRTRHPQSGDHGVFIGIGPGMTVAAMLLRWP
jgi:polyketide synthase Type III